MNGKTTVLVIILILLGIAGGYYLGANYKLTLQPQTAENVTVTTPTATPTPMTEVMANTGTPSAAVVTPTVDETATVIAAVKAGLVAEHGPDAASLTVTVSKIVGNFAQGSASASAGGGMWLATKLTGTWKLVWDGNGSILCATVNPYNFPTTMVPQCWDDATQTTVTR